MYKSRLQELCQAKYWSLPNYSMSREGPDHAPRFKACIVVNGVPFESSDLCRSSKEAQNEAARLAYEHFVRPVRSQSPDSAASLSDSISSQGSSSTNAAWNDPSEKEVVLEKNPEISIIPVSDVIGSGVKDLKEHGELQHIYKNTLQSYAQKRNLNLPMYSCKREGPPHAIRFKASVTIDGKTFESPEFFRTLKEAEHAAAKAALATLSEDGIQEQDSSFYKNLLQDLVQKEGFPLPKYVTARSGPPHLPTFVCNVEIGGNSFEGTAAKTKKQAETNAAKVAYYSLEERRVSRKSALLYQGSQVKESNECLSSSSIPIVIVDFEKGLKCRETLGSTSNLESHKHGKENEVPDQKVHSAETISARANSSSQSKKKPGTSSRSISRNSSDEVYANLRDPFPSVAASLEGGQSLSSTDSDCSDDAVTSSNSNLPTRTKSLLRVNKVQVFPRRPGIELPKGTTIFPFSDDKWVAVSSDFPTHQSKLQI